MRLIHHHRDGGEWRQREGITINWLVGKGGGRKIGDFGILLIILGVSTLVVL